MPSLLTLTSTVLSTLGVFTFASPLISNDVSPADAAVEARDEWQPTASTLTCLYMTTESEWGGEGLNLCEVGGTCSGKLPDGLAANISSAGPEAGITCFLFSEQNCAGDKSAPLVNPGYGDLNSIGFDKKAQSWQCWKWCGWMGTSSASSTATASSTASASTVRALFARLVSITTTIDASEQTATTAAGLPSVSTSSSSSAVPTTTSSSASTQAQIFETSMTTIVFTHTYVDGSTTVVSSPLAIPVPVTSSEPEDAVTVVSLTTTVGQTMNAPAPFPTPVDSTTSSAAGVSITTTLGAESSTSMEAGVSITTTEAAESAVTTLSSEGVTLAVPTLTSEGVTVPVPSVSPPASASSPSNPATEAPEDWASLVTLTGVDATLTITVTGEPAASPTA